jgi:hypothetical protein
MVGIPNMTPSQWHDLYNLAIVWLVFAVIIGAVGLIGTLCLIFRER